jgi:hypothetical protein
MDQDNRIHNFVFRISSSFYCKYNSFNYQQELYKIDINNNFGDSYFIIHVLFIVKRIFKK